jgi:hypothetical protein
MVFAINAVESGPNNFESFQQLALHSNSSAAGASTTAATAPTGTPTSAAGKVGARAVAELVVGVVFGGVVAVML